MLHQQVGDESDFWEQATINFAELPHDDHLAEEAFHSAAYDRYYALLHATIEAMRGAAA